MVGAFLINQLLRSFQHPVSVGRSWRLICPALGLVMAVVAFKKPEILGWVSGLLFLGFVLLPNLAAKVIERQLQRGHFTLPLLLAKAVRLIHPGDGLWDLPSLIQILNLWDLDQNGKKEEAENLWRALPTERVVTLRYSYTLGLQIEAALGEWGNI